MDTFTNGGFTSYQHIKAVIDRHYIGAHLQWRPEIIKDASLSRSAHIPSNRHSPQASHYWKTSILAVADTTVIHNSNNPSLNSPIMWCGLSNIAGIN